MESGNKIFKIDDNDNKAEDLSLSLKYNGDTGFTNSVLKYPIYFHFLNYELCEVYLIFVNNF